jgi:hypothetical protein
MSDVNPALALPVKPAAGHSPAPSLDKRICGARQMPTINRGILCLVIEIDSRDSHFGFSALARNSLLRAKNSLHIPCWAQ